MKWLHRLFAAFFGAPSKQQSTRVTTSSQTQSVDPSPAQEHGSDPVATQSALADAAHVILPTDVPTIQDSVDLSDSQILLQPPAEPASEPDALGSNVLLDVEKATPGAYTKPILPEPDTQRDVQANIEAESEEDKSAELLKFTPTSVLDEAKLHPFEPANFTTSNAYQEVNSAIFEARPGPLDSEPSSSVVSGSNGASSPNFWNYLGPGVSSRLNLHQADLTRLRQLNLPELQTPAQLAEALGLSQAKLRWLAYHNELATRIHYVRFEIPKRDGGRRTLMAPQQTLARAQRWIFDTILSPLQFHDAAHGFIKGRGILSNATSHAGQKILINLDLSDFFPSIGFYRVRHVFEAMGFSPSVATVLGLLCTECPRVKVANQGVVYHAANGPRGLPQGACTSPALSNLVALRLDRRLTGLARTVGATYTRYADDLTFSGNAELIDGVGAFLSRVKHVVRDEGFVVHPRKTRVLKQNTAQMVTGLVVNDRPRVRRSEVRRVRAILHRAGHEGLEAQNREQHANFRSWLQGKIAYIGMSDPRQAEKFLAQLKAIENPEGA